MAPYILNLVTESRIVQPVAQSLIRLFSKIVHLKTKNATPKIRNHLILITYDLKFLSGTSICDACRGDILILICSVVTLFKN